MTTSAMTTDLGHAPSRPHAVRLLLLGFALAVLLAASFAVGHLTGSSPRGSVTGPTPVHAPAAATDVSGSYCQAGHLRGPC